MFLPAIPEIRVETAGNDVTYWLPARPLGKIRWLGLLPVGFSVAWLAGVGHVLLGVVRQLSNSKQPGFEYFVAAFFLAFVVAGCIPAGFGLLLLFGRCRVRWRDGRLTVSDSLGFLGWRRRMPRAAIRKFTVAAGPASNRPAATTGPLAGVAMLLAQFERGKPRIVAAGYPREWLEAMAADLSGRAGQSQPAPPQVEVSDGRENPPQFHDVVEKPADSKVVIQRQSASIVLEVPPAGLRKGTMGLFFFASFWCLFMVLFTSVVLFGKQQPPAKESLPAWPFLAGFWAVGLAMMAGAVNLGRRQATLKAGNSGLTVIQSGPFGVKRREFRRGEIAAICAGASNVSVNHSRLFELQIHPVTGKKVGLLVGRDAAELRWMAAELTNALGVAAESESPSTNPITGANAASLLNPKPNVGGAFILFLILAAVSVAVFWCLGPDHEILAPFAGAGRGDLGRQATQAATLSKSAESSTMGNLIAGRMAFSSFGPSNSYQTNAWHVGSDAHADWFVPTASGRLAEVQLAIEPAGNAQQAGNATVSIAKDRRGFPGATLETFSVPAMAPTAAAAAGPIVLTSVTRPALRAGVKYWMCVRSSGLWQWHFNDQSMVQNSTRQLTPRKWASAGDSCYLCAFRVMLTTNQPSSTPADGEPAPVK
jgi:hypothetical protein